MYRQTMAKGLDHVFLKIGAQRLLGLTGYQEIHEVILPVAQRLFDEFCLADPAPPGYDGKLSKSMGQLPRFPQFGDFLRPSKELQISVS